MSSRKRGSALQFDDELTDSARNHKRIESGENEYSDYLITCIIYNRL